MYKTTRNRVHHDFGGGYFNSPCTNCGKNLKVREELAGRTARCPYGHGHVVVPQPPAPASPLDVDLSQVAPPGITTSLVPRKKTPASRGAAAPKRAAEGSGVSGTNVSLLWTALVGLGMTLVFFAVLGSLLKRT